jgi:hypothetical protein
VGVVKLRVLQGLWRRLVGVGIIGPGLSGSGLYNALGRVVPPLARPSPCALSALRRTSDDETMTIPGGAGTPTLESMLQLPPCSAHRLLS